MTGHMTREQVGAIRETYDAVNWDHGVVALCDTALALMNERDRLREALQEIIEICDDGMPRGEVDVARAALEADE